MTGWWREAPDGVSVTVKVHPRARRPGLRGVVPGAHGPLLSIAVTAPPADGAANRAVCDALAAALDVAPSAVSVLNGAGNREKHLLVRGDPASLGARLSAL